MKIEKLKTEGTMNWPNPRDICYKINELCDFANSLKEEGEPKPFAILGYSAVAPEQKDWEKLDEQIKIMLGAYNAEILNEYQNKYLMQYGPGCEEILFPVLEKATKDFIDFPQDIPEVKTDALKMFKSFISSTLQADRESLVKAVEEKVETAGKVTRNFALKNFISRLGALICDFRKEGMDIEAKFVEGDYVYVLKDKPKEIKTYYVNGVKVAPDKYLW